MAKRIRKDLKEDVQVPNWGNFQAFSYALPQLQNIKLAGEGLFYAKIGDLTSFVIKFEDPRYYTEDIEIKIMEETTGNVILDVVPFETAKGYGIRAFYVMSETGRICLDITIAGVPIPRITVGVDVNNDYVHSLEISNMKLLRLLSQETERKRQLQAVYNELNNVMEELPNICQNAIQSVTLATQRSTEIINRAHRLVYRFPQPPGPAPPVCPTTQGDESPRDGPKPAPSVPSVIGPIPPRRASSATTSRQSEQPGVKRKSDDDLGETEPVKRGRWFTPSAMTIAEDRANCSSSHPQRNARTCPLSSGSTGVSQQLYDLPDSIIEGVQEVEAPTQDRPPKGLETPSTSSTAAASAVSLQSPESNAAIQGSSCPSLNSSWRSSMRSQAPTDTAVKGSPCPSLVSSRRSSLRSQAPTDTAIQGSPCPSLASSRSSRVSLVRAVRGSPCPSLASSADEEDSPHRNPRYNPYYWLRPMARINYRMSLKGPWQ